MATGPGHLRKLTDALTGRRIEEGFRLLDGEESALSRLSPSDPLAASYLLCLAQWVDLGYRDPEYLDPWLAQFSKVRRGDMRVLDYLQLRMTEAFRAFAAEDQSTSTSILEMVLGVLLSVWDPKLAFLAHFWKSRSHRKKGEYKLALHHIVEARNLAEQLPAAKLVAVTKIHESWLLFQKGQRRDAFRLLDEAEAELTPVNHVLSLGNIESARGRFVRRSGEYGKALEHFERAIAIYSTRFPRHPNMARALVNAAYVKRLIALDLSHKSKTGKARGAHHARYLEVCREALDLLQRAAEIYSLHSHHGGTGSVLVNAGYLHLESGDLDRASGEALKAHRLGEEKQDHILMARSRILLAAIENARAEEEIEETLDTSVHANLAARYADEAIALAQQTQNKRLLAGAYIARGATAASDFFEDWEAAKRFTFLAGELLGNEDRDHLLKELSLLKARVLKGAGVDHALRSWSEGLVGDKTFQQITEEFAEIVIPKVWAREGRKIARVAGQLSISPKKVRRILRNVHLLGPNGDRAPAHGRKRREPLSAGHSNAEDGWEDG